MKQERLIGLEWLRGLAAFGIVGCHTDLECMTQGALWLKRFTDLNVGVFAVLAGFFSVLTISRSCDWKNYFFKRCYRLLLPLLIWTVFYVTVDILFDSLSGKTLTFQPMRWHYWVSLALYGGGAAHLWFLPSLFYAQMGTYLLLRIGKSYNAHLLLIWLLGIGGLVLVGVCPMIGGWTGMYLWRLVGFFCFGMLLGENVERLGRLSPWWGFGGVFMGGVMIALGWRHGFIGECVLIVPLVLLGISWRPCGTRLIWIGKWLGRLSFGVYLVHVFLTVALREVIRRMGLPHNAIVYLLDWIVAWGLAMGCSVIGYRLATRVPILAAVFPTR